MIYNWLSGGISKFFNYVKSSREKAIEGKNALENEVFRQILGVDLNWIHLKNIGTNFSFRFEATGSMRGLPTGVAIGISFFLCNSIYRLQNAVVSENHFTFITLRYGD